MSKIKNYDRALYESVEAGLREFMKPHRFEDIKNENLIEIYTPMAYEQVAAFLCINDIPHTFTINPVNSKMRARIVMVSWIENGSERNLAWWEKTGSDCYLVRFEENWADEMDIYGFAIFTAEEYNNWCHVLSRLREAMKHAVFTYSFGTNEEQEYEDFEEFLNCFKVKVIPAEHAEMFRNAFDTNEYYGQFPTIDALNYYIEDMLHDVEEDE